MKVSEVTSTREKDAEANHSLELEDNYLVLQSLGVLKFFLVLA